MAKRCVLYVYLCTLRNEISLLCAAILLTIHPPQGNWNAYSVGPFRDLVGDLITTIRARGLYAGLYFSLYEWYTSFLCIALRNDAVFRFNPLYRSPDPHQYVSEVLS